MLLAGAVLRGTAALLSEGVGGCSQVPERPKLLLQLGALGLQCLENQRGHMFTLIYRQTHRPVEPGPA